MPILGLPRQIHSVPTLCRPGSSYVKQGWPMHSLQNAVLPLIPACKDPIGLGPTIRRCSILWRALPRGGALPYNDRRHVPPKRPRYFLQILHPMTPFLKDLHWMPPFYRNLLKIENFARFTRNFNEILSAPAQNQPILRASRAILAKFWALEHKNRPILGTPNTEWPPFFSKFLHRKTPSFVLPEAQVCHFHIRVPPRGHYPRK